jgi:hypothetical protein
MEEERSIYYNLMVFLITGLLCALCIVNAVIYSRISNEKNESLTSLSPSGAKALMWINIIIAIVTGVFALYYIIRVIFTRAARQRIKESSIEYIKSGGKYVKEKGASAYQKVRNFNINDYGRKDGLFDFSSRTPQRVEVPERPRPMMRDFSD